jgi:hypothetical protein
MGRKWDRRKNAWASFSERKIKKNMDTHSNNYTPSTPFYRVVLEAQ